MNWALSTLPSGPVQVQMIWDTSVSIVSPPSLIGVASLLSITCVLQPGTFS